MSKLSLVTIITLITLVCGQHVITRWSKEQLSPFDHRTHPIHFNPGHVSHSPNQPMNHPTLHIRHNPSSSVDTRILPGSSSDYQVGISEHSRQNHPPPISFQSNHQLQPLYRAYHDPIHVPLSQLYHRPHATVSMESFKTVLPSQPKTDSYSLHHRHAASNRLPINYSQGNPNPINHLPIDNYHSRLPFSGHHSFESQPMESKPIETDPSKNCWVMYEGYQLNCYANSLLHQDKIAQLRQRGMLTAEHVDEQFDSCDLRSNIRWDDQQARSRRKRHLQNFSIISNHSSSAANSEPKYSKNMNNTHMLASHSHAYPEGYPATYTVHGLFADNLPINLVSSSKHSSLHSSIPSPSSPSSSLSSSFSSPESISDEEPSQTEELNRCFLNAGLTLLKPYHMYNMRGQVRFIVQEEQLRLSQCQPKAICSFSSLEPLPLRYDCPAGSGENGLTAQLSGRFHCDRRLCTHQMLSFDPSDLTKFIFYDEFAFECCCRCQLRSLPTPMRPCTVYTDRKGPMN